jgi:hypothetical protein
MSCDTCGSKQNILASAYMRIIAESKYVVPTNLAPLGSHLLQYEIAGDKIAFKLNGSGSKLIGR